MKAAPSETVIAVHGLTKKFGDFTALSKLELQVKKGEVHGFLGPNGAGKSTTIRILLGLLRATDGELSVLGADPWKEATALHARLAYIPGEVNLWPNLSGGEVIDLFAKLRGGGNPQKRQELLERFQLDPTKKCRTYSKGNRQKVAIVAALASEAELYIMDEPTTGLDPLMEELFQQYVQELKVAGKTVLLSSHILAEAEALCDRITIIREGQAVESGTLAELRHLTHLSVEVDTRQPVIGLAAQPGVHELTLKGTHAEFQAEHAKLQAILLYLSTFEIHNLISKPPSLEKLFMRHYHDAPHLTRSKRAS